MFAPQVLAAVMSAVMSAASVPKLFSVALQPLGHVDRSTLESLAKRLETDLRVRVTIFGPEPLPASAFYAPRGRYRAGELVAFLERTTPPGFTHVLGVTAHDISAPKGEVADWGVLGVAKLGEGPASSPRTASARATPPTPFSRRGSAAWRPTSWPTVSAFPTARRRTAS